MKVRPLFKKRLFWLILIFICALLFLLLDGLSPCPPGDRDSATGPSNTSAYRDASVPAEPSTANSDTGEGRGRSRIYIESSLSPTAYSRFIVPTAEVKAIPWQYTTKKPSRDWFEPDYADADWHTGKAGFGSKKKTAPIGTAWTSPEIWMRRAFSLEASIDELPGFWIQHDEDVAVYLNGVLAARKKGRQSSYGFVPLSAAGREALHPGRNVIAVHGRNQRGPQYVDVGLAVFPRLDLPLTGRDPAPSLEIISRTVQRFMEDNLIPSGTLAVMKKNRVVIARGFGYADRNRTIPIQPDALMRLASLDKLITKAAMKVLIRQNPPLPTGERLQLSTPVFPLLETFGMTLPGGANPDPRLNDITIEHLLEHRSGLERLPGQARRTIESDLGIRGKASAEDAVRWLLSRPLRFTPGSKKEYSNSAYGVARYVIQVITGDLLRFLKNNVIRPAAGVGLAYDLPSDRDHREPWYSSGNHIRSSILPKKRAAAPGPGVETNLQRGLGLIASAEAMVRLLRSYHMGHGTPLLDPKTGRWAAVPDNGYGVFFGRFGGTFTLAMQRRWDEVNVAVLFNQNGDYTPLAEELKGILDALPEKAWPVK